MRRLLMTDHMGGRQRAARRVLPSVPKHLALIPDGNRRWSSSHRLALLSGYKKGVAKFIDFSIWAKGFGVKTLTVWALSTENIMNRSSFEIHVLYGLYEKAAKDPKIFETLKANRARIKVIGNRRMIPKRVRDALRSLELRTRSFGDFTINLLIGYGGVDDLSYAFKRLCSSAATGKKIVINEESISRNMRTASIPKVDFVIRTSGEMRTSGFLPLQAGYSELYFADKYWPDFGKRDLATALKSFSERQRRFGK